MRFFFETLYLKIQRFKFHQKILSQTVFSVAILPDPNKKIRSIAPDFFTDIVYVLYP